MAPLVLTVDLGPGVRAAVTGRGSATPIATVGVPGNVSHRRPHRPDDLAAARRVVGDVTATDPTTWHLMRQVHGAAVGVVDAATPPGHELRDVDALVTAEPDRVLAVQTADCVPLLLAGPTTVGAVHAGRVGFGLGVVDATLRQLSRLGDPPAGLRAVIGPAIGGCCYEVPIAMRDEISNLSPATAAETSSGRPSLDLPAGVVATLRAAGVTTIEQVGGCTRCDPDGRWFSHRADPATGRQLGLVVRASAVAA